MKYTNYYEEDHRMIQSAHYNKSLVLFVGAGASVSAGMPSWSKAVKRFSEGLEINEKDWDLLKVPQIYFNERGSKEYIQTAREVFKFGEPIKPTALDTKIAEVEPQRIITTNYDHLIEDALSDEGLFYQILSSDTDIPFHDSNREIIKMHGDFEHDNFVLKEDDYLSYSENFRMIETYVKAIIARSIVVFVGYGLNDPDVKQILNWVKTVTQPHYQRAYFIQTAETYNQYTVNYYRNLGVNIIFPDKMFDRDFTYEASRQEQYACDMLNYLVFGADNNSLNNLYYNFYYLDQLNSLMDQQIIKYLHKVGLDIDSTSLKTLNSFEGEASSAYNLLLKIAARAIEKNKDQTLTKEKAQSENEQAKKISAVLDELTKEERDKLDLILNVLWKTGIRNINTVDWLETSKRPLSTLSKKNKSDFDFFNIQVPEYTSEFYIIAKSIEDAALHFDLTSLEGISSKLSMNKTLTVGKRDLLTAYCQFTQKKYGSAFRFLQYASKELYEEKEYLWYLISEINRKWAGRFAKFTIFSKEIMSTDAAAQMGKASDKIDPKHVAKKLPIDMLAIRGNTEIFDDVSDNIFCNEARTQLDSISRKVDKELGTAYMVGPSNPAIFRMRSYADGLRSFVMHNLMFLDAFTDVTDGYKCFTDSLLKSISSKDIINNEGPLSSRNVREDKAHGIDLYFVLKAYSSSQLSSEIRGYHLNKIELYEDGKEFLQKIVNNILSREQDNNIVSTFYELLPFISINREMAEQILESISVSIKQDQFRTSCSKIANFVLKNFSPNDSEKDRLANIEDNETDAADAYFLQDGGYTKFFERIVKVAEPECAMSGSIQNALSSLSAQWVIRGLSCKSDYISNTIKDPVNLILAIEISKCLSDEDKSSLKVQIEKALPFNTIDLYVDTILNGLIEPDKGSEEKYLLALKDNAETEIQDRKQGKYSFPSTYEVITNALITLLLNNKTISITIDELKKYLLDDDEKSKFLVAVAEHSDKAEDYKVIQVEWLQYYSDALLRDITKNKTASKAIKDKFISYANKNGEHAEMNLLKIYFKWFAFDEASI